MENGASCYEILGVQPTASSAEIKQAYRKLALSHHPDRGGNPAEFASINKAYEILSDLKSRTNYDSTGRTSKLSAEEEFVQAMRSSTADVTNQASAATQPAQPVPPEPDRSQVPQPAWFPPRHSPSDPEGSLPETVREGRKSKLKVGSKVRLTGLLKQPGLNSVAGTLIELHADRWQVRLEADLGDKLFKPSNLVLDDFEPSTSSSASILDFSFSSSLDSSNVFIVGSWNNWKPLQMNFDQQQCCYVCQVELKTGHSENFQFLLGGDGLERCIHPDKADASPYHPHRLLGPDDMGHALNWAIGRHDEDMPSVGARYDIMLFYGARGQEDRVEWLHINRRVAAATPEPPRASLIETNSVSPPATSIADFLQICRPDWKPKDLAVVVDKLSRISVIDLEGLLFAVQAKGPDGVNERLRAAGEKAFAVETVKAFRQQATLLNAEAEAERRKRRAEVEVKRKALREAAVHASAAPKRGPSAKLPLSALPVQTYQVVHEVALVRQEPCLAAPALGKREAGQILQCSDETFDGWVKLLDGPGYVLKDMCGNMGVNVVLKEIAQVGELVIPHPINLSVLTFEVVHQPFVVVRMAPAKDRPIQRSRKFGERVRADAQSYGGWIHVVEPDGGGWMLTVDPELGVLLSCCALQDRQRCEEALEKAVLDGGARDLAAALADARRVGLDGSEVMLAEEVLKELCQRDALYDDLRKRATSAKASGLESELQECLKLATDNRFQDLQHVLLDALEELQAKQDQIQKEHKFLLDELAQAASDGDPAVIKLAREAAKDGGVPPKEIARVFALHNHGGWQAWQRGA